MSREYNHVEEEKRENRIEQADDRIDILQVVDDMIRGLKVFWVWFLLVISVSSSLFYFRAKLSYVPQYQSYVTFIINTSIAENYGSSYYNNATASQMAKTFPYIINNEAMRRIIAEDLGVENIPGSIQAEAVDSTNMITLSATAENPQLAYNILQSVIDNYPQIAKLVVGETEMIVMDENGIGYSPINGDGAQTMAKLGFLVGGVLCFLWLLLYAVTKKTIRHEEDFAKILNVRCIGGIPKVVFKKRSNKAKNLVLVGNNSVSYGFTEANRTLRTRIERDAAEHKAKIYLVSSATANEGKTTVAANLALSLADKGLKVLLVDFDLRNPSVHKALGIKRDGNGAVDILLGDAEIKDVIRNYGETNLQIIMGGNAVTNTEKALRVRNLERVFAQLRDMADYIIVDSSPIGLITDVGHIEKYVDAGIFVVRQDYASVPRILDGIETLSDGGLRLAGCVLNLAESTLSGYGSGYSYGYGYGKYGKYGDRK